MVKEIYGLDVLTKVDGLGVGQEQNIESYQTPEVVHLQTWITVHGPKI